MELLFNFVIGIVLLIFFKESTKIDGMVISSDKIGPNGFPQAIIIISFLLLIYITYKNIKDRNKAGFKESFDFKDKGFRVMFTSIVLLAIYIFTMNIIGFILGTFLFSVLASIIMGYRETLKTVIFSLVLTVAITLIFGKLFFVSLPRGLGILREISYIIY